MHEPDENYIVARIVTNNVNGEDILTFVKEGFFSLKSQAKQYIQDNSYIDYTIITEYRSIGEY